jgi:hypothetical protein
LFVIKEERENVRVIEFFLKDREKMKKSTKGGEAPEVAIFVWGIFLQPPEGNRNESAK